MHPSKLSYVAGGVARNICEALTKMGSTPSFITAIGDDEAGKLLTSMMPEQMKDKSLVLRGKNTAQCVIVLDSKGDCSHLLADFDIHNEITPEMIHKNEDIIKRAKLIVLDANISVKSMGTILKYATEHKVPVFFEPTDVIVAAKPFETDFWKAVKIITPNINELYFIGSYLKILPSEKECECESIEDIAQLAKEVASFVENIIVTLGSNGVLIARRARACDTFLTQPKNEKIEIRHYPAEIVKNVVNVSGAGDCFASGLILSTLKGLPEEKCVSVGFSAAKKALKSSSAVGDDMFVENLEDWEDCAKYYVVETERLNKMPHT